MAIRKYVAMVPTSFSFFLCSRVIIEMFKYTFFVFLKLEISYFE